MRSTATFLYDARRLGHTPGLDRDAILDNLQPLKMPRPQPEFLRPPEIRELLEAALRHDRKTFNLTREEKQGLSLVRLLAAMKLQSTPREFVFGLGGELPSSQTQATLKRLVRDFGAPPFNWQRLRQTTASYLVNAAGIFGAASAYREARQLGHSVSVAERHYTDVIRDIPKEAQNLEQAMRIVDLADAIIAAAAHTPSEESAGGTKAAVGG